MIHKHSISQVLLSVFSPVVACRLRTLRHDVFQDPRGYEHRGQFPPLLADSLLCFQEESPMELKHNYFLFCLHHTRGSFSTAFSPMGQSGSFRFP